MPIKAPKPDIMRPSNKKIRIIWLSLAPKLRRVRTSSFLSIISMEMEPMMLKLATKRINVRNR